MTKEGFIQYYPLFSKDAEERENYAGYSMNGSKNIWEALIVFHSRFSSDAFDVFDQNHDGVITFPEFLFMLACDSNSNLAKKYGGIFEM